MPDGRGNVRGVDLSFVAMIKILSSPKPKVLGTQRAGCNIAPICSVAYKADEMSPAALQSISISLFIGIALIILSAILFIKASGTER